jgi:hypothetical protein
MRTTIPFALLATMLSCFLLVAPAQAQRDRVFVASYGSDTNPCTFGSPCKTFQHAHDSVAAGGEITAIDSAGFGPVTITKSVTITSPAGVEAGITAAASGDAIVINAGINDVVSLHGLTLNGAGTAGYGIVYNTADYVEVIDCTISNYLFAGIDVVPSSVFGKFSISNTTISNINNPGNQSTNSGIYVAALPSTHIILSIDRVSINNSFYAIYIGDVGGSVFGIISNSHLFYCLNGIYVTGSSNALNEEYFLNDALYDSDLALSGESTAYLSHVTVSAGTTFISGTNTAAYGDGTNHLSEITGSVGTWAGQ